MHIVIKLVFGALLLLGAIFMFASKKQNNFVQSGRPATAHTYYYYPKANFYYDSSEGNYICWDSADAAWNKTDKLPVQEVDLGKRVRIGEIPEPVWSENQHHRLIYSVYLYSDPEDFKKEEKLVGETKKPGIETGLKESEKKSGVRRFFERVFPPRKKKDS